MAMFNSFLYVHQRLPASKTKKPQQQWLIANPFSTARIVGEFQTCFDMARTVADPNSQSSWDQQGIQKKDTRVCLKMLCTPKPSG